MFKLNRVNRNALSSIAILIIIILVIGFFNNKSMYQPRPITVDPVNEKSIFDLETRIDCTPGQTSEGSAYTKDLTPGGICGAQKLVSDIASYGIVDGIGGSLI
jgi:hypothetical protein